MTKFLFLKHDSISGPREPKLLRVLAWAELTDPTFPRMKLFVGILLCSLVLGVSSQRWLTFLKEAGQGTKDMWRAYSDMREANYKGADKYFHARGNYDAAQRGPGGAWAAKVIR
ncbi:serum amyloid A-1 protein-like isoform X2 [Felis catus]|uniref:serum amyloid A-1 protein-like isoform X2 n=1 Tax=Felis catus TaxID=9685 RepID=UPI001D1A323C|nr:serum amyloid A-1 protein-like isoform X2 [Felis catus]